MRRPLLAAALAVVPFFARAAELTALETRWLSAAAPVLAYAKSIALPFDIIVQPKPRPGDVPIAMGFADGRCKLVLSLRDNPDAETVLAGVPQDEQEPLIAAMAAHELAHCWRHTQGVWHALPAGFVEEGEETAADPGLLVASREMREMRREEGYADLVALAWILHSNPEQYGRVHGWLARLRAHQPVPRGGHDTRVWVKLAEDARRFGNVARPFEDAAPLWREGLLTGG